MRRLTRENRIMLILYVAFFLLALGLGLAGCGDCGESFVVDVTTTTDDETLSHEPCYDADTAGYDLAGCCPDGYEAVGLDAGGAGVVCVGRCP